jgi:hypothetical protein
MTDSTSPDHGPRSTPSRLSRRELIGLTAALGLVVAACSDDESPQASTDITTTEVEPPTTTRPDPTTTSTVPDSTVAESSTTTTPVVQPTWPLTGMPLPFGAESGRPAMVVKLDNHPIARPQSGLNEADIVFEENVEQLTRFAAVFHSNGADPVGPIRSGRTQDVDLLGSFNRPLFVWSGGNRRVADAIGGSDLFQIDPTVARGIMFRSSRPGPHDLYADMSKLYTLAPADSGPPPPQFTYRAPDDVAAGDPTAGVKLSMDNVRVLWRWDEDSSTYLRWSDDVPHKDTVFDAQFSTDNVVVLLVDYRPSPADGRSPEAQTIGTGEAWVFSGGRTVTGTWTRPDRLSPFALTDAAGAVIALTPGRTMIELCRAGKVAALPDGADVDTVAYP